jgi:hypothetical protein
MDAAERTSENRSCPQYTTVCTTTGHEPIFVTIVNILYGGQYSDLCYGYSAFWRQVLPVLDGEEDGFEIETAMAIRALTSRLRVVEVPSFEFKRVYGAERLRTIPYSWRVLKAILRERTVPRRTTIQVTRGKQYIESTGTLFVDDADQQASNLVQMEVHYQR